MRYEVVLVVLTLVACNGDDDGDKNDTADRVSATCEAYCLHSAECDDEVDVEVCRNDCEEAAGNCQADEQEQALDELDACAAESCDDVTACTVGSALECYWGI